MSAASKEEYPDPGVGTNQQSNNTTQGKGRRPRSQSEEPSSSSTTAEEEKEKKTLVTQLLQETVHNSYQRFAVQYRIDRYLVGTEIYNRFAGLDFRGLNKKERKVKTFD